MPYQLYNRRGSGGFAVEAALTLADEPYELIAIDSQPSTSLPETFRTTNPWRQVPVLILPDGTIMTETAAILAHIAATHPGDDIGPPAGTSEYATLLRWLVFLSVNVYEGTLRRIYPERFTVDTIGADGIREAAITRNGEAFTLLETELQSERNLLGDGMSLADIFLAMLYAWHPASEDFLNCEALTHRVAGHSVIAPIWQHNFDHRMPVKWGRI